MLSGVKSLDLPVVCLSIYIADSQWRLSNQHQAPCAIYCRSSRRQLYYRTQGHMLCIHNERISEPAGDTLRRTHDRMIPRVSCLRARELGSCGG